MYGASSSSHRYCNHNQFQRLFFCDGHDCKYCSIIPTIFDLSRKSKKIYVALDHCYWIKSPRACCCCYFIKRPHGWFQGLGFEYSIGPSMFMATPLSEEFQVIKPTICRLKTLGSVWSYSRK